MAPGSSTLILMGFSADIGRSRANSALQGCEKTRKL